MKNGTPGLIGEKLPVMAYIEPELFEKIEAMRGDVPRSKFLGNILKNSI